MMSNTRTFEKGNTVHFETVYRDVSLEPTDPTDFGWTIYRSNGVKVDDSVTSHNGPYKRATGTYWFRTKLTSTGDYYVEWTGKVNGYDTTVRKPFRIISTNEKQ